MVAGLTLAATTEPRDIIAGLEGKLPRQIVQIMAMMVRYLDVTSDQLRRMRIARESRGFVARNPRHWPVLAQGAGAFFVRSYERGERVHLAMLSRGYAGSLPGLRHRSRRPIGDWLSRVALPLVAVAGGAVPLGRCDEPPPEPVLRGHAISPTPIPTDTRRCTGSTSTVDAR